MVPNIPSNTYYLSKVSFRGGTPSGGAQDAAYVTLRKFFFTPAPGKIKHLGTRILNISKDFRITSTYRTPNREETKSYLSETYPGSPWLAREFVEKEVQSTAGEYNIKLGDAYRKLGREFTKERNLSQAIEYFKKALQANPDFPAAYNDLGNAYRRRGWEDTRSYGDAMAAYQKALEIDPNYDLAQANLGRLYRMMGKYEESISELEKAVKLNPSRAYTHDQLCLTLKFMGKMAEAVEACKRAIAVNPNFKSAYMNLATVYRATGRLEDAISALQEILEIDPNYLSAHEQLVAIYLRQGKTDKAEEHSNIVKELRKLPHR
ncbi:MAG: tetratricopeptide repeat protein [Candidatus Binatia bacterium]